MRPGFAIPRFVFVLALLAALAAGADAQTFTKITDPANPIISRGGAPTGSFNGAAWVDTDGDGDLDLFIARLGLYRNDGGGVFTYLGGAITSQGTPTGTTWADIDNDGDLDCYIAGATSHGSALYRNMGGNVFAKVTTGAIADTLVNFGWAAAFADYDRDGLVDLVLAAPVGFNGVTGPNRLFHNDGGGSFTRIDTSTVATGLAPYTVPSWSDFDNDGDPDLFIGSGSGGGPLLIDYLYRNRVETAANWFQRYLAAPLGTDLHDGQLYNFIDVDNDGDLDIYLTNFGAHPNDLYENQGGGVYVKKTSAQVGPIVSDLSQGLASIWEDFDNDGDLDCYVTRGGATLASYYRNDGGVFVSLSLPNVTVSGPHWGASAADYDGDGQVDLFVTGTTATQALLRNTTANGNHWLDVHLTGTLSNRSAIGARVRLRCVINGTPRWQMREISSQNSFDGMSRFDPHFGLGSSLSADSLVVEWPSGRRSVLVNLTADASVPVVEPNDPTAVTVSLVSVDAAPGRVRIVWSIPSTGAELLGVERRDPDGGWRAAVSARADGSGRVVYEDSSVTPGSRYAFRLVVRDGDGIQRRGETEVAVPAGYALAIRSLGANPGSGPLRVSFEVPRAADASLELLDASGRLVDRQPSAGGPGARTLELGRGKRFTPGVYWVRLKQGAAEVSARIVRIE